jgi:hypothetical protein
LLDESHAIEMINPKTKPTGADVPPAKAHSIRRHAQWPRRPATTASARQQRQQGQQRHRVAQQ